MKNPMVTIANHLKMTVTSALRVSTREFYGGVLRLKSIPSPAENLDLYEFPGGLCFFPTTRLNCWRSRIISRLRGWNSSWVDDLAQWKEPLQRFGVTEIKYDDPSRFAEPYACFFFQAPGGQVFRLARFSVLSADACLISADRIDHVE